VGGNGNNQWEWDGNGNENKAKRGSENRNEPLGMGGNGIKKSFPLISSLYVQRCLLFPELGRVRDPRTEAFGRRDERVVLAVLLEVRDATAVSQYNKRRHVV